MKPPKPIIHIVHLYPHEMNIYGDTGNRLVLARRLQWRGLIVSVSLVGVGQAIPDNADIIIGGGGQDSGQDSIQQDLQTKADTLHKMATDKVVMLMVCGLYQLFGRRFVTSEAKEIKGIGLLPLETWAGPKRLIGNTSYSSPWGELVGYENHSGLTQLDNPQQALAHVLRGEGNNGQDRTEGCIIENVFGTYSHGPILSKNPKLADELIVRALTRRYGLSSLPPLDDSLEMRAALAAKQRPH